AQERVRVRSPALMGLRAGEQQQPLAARVGPPLEELAPWPVDVAAAVGPHAHLGPLQREHEELLGIDPRDTRGPELLHQVAQRARRGAAGVDPAAEGDDQRGEIARRLAVELDVIHHCTVTERAPAADRSIASISVWRCTARPESASHAPALRRAQAGVRGAAARGAVRHALVLRWHRHEGERLLALAAVELAAAGVERGFRAEHERALAPVDLDAAGAPIWPP